MRLLILTIVAMGGLALMMEFVLVDTARLANEAQHGPVEITFQVSPGSQWNAKPGPASGTGHGLPGENEARAGQLWRSLRVLQDARARHEVLRAIVKLDSSYRARAERALLKAARVARSESVGEPERER